MQRETDREWRGCTGGAGARHPHGGCSLSAPSPHTRGQCDACGTGNLAHGLWTVEQIEEVSKDLGTPPADFTDWCDPCFVQMVAGGDAKYAEQLAGRPMRLAGGAL